MKTASITPSLNAAPMGNQAERLAARERRERRGGGARNFCFALSAFFRGSMGSVRWAFAVLIFFSFLDPGESQAANTHAATLVRSSNQYFSAPDSPSLSITGDLTVEAWVKIGLPPSSGQQYSIVNKDDGGNGRSFSFWYNNSGTPQLSAHIFGPAYAHPDGFLNVTRNFDLGTGWHHLAIVCTITNPNLTKVAFYVDGIAIGYGVVADGSGTSAIKDGSAELRIGRGHTGEFFDGKIDEVRLWAAARTPSQISATMSNQLAGTDANLRGYWKLNNSLSDSTTNGNTLVNPNGASFQSADLPFEVGVYDPPVIVFQPASGVALAGNRVTLSVLATGALLNYRWFFNETNLLAGQTNSSLILTNVQLNQSGLYSVRLTNSFATAVSSNATLTVVMPGLDDDSDGLLNELEIQLGTNPRNSDTDGDGLGDYNELFVRATNPLLADTDGDGMPDGWEVLRGLNPLVNDAGDDFDLDGLANFQEFQMWSTNNLQRPDRADSLGDGRSDYERLFGTQTNRFYYDRNDRLTGANYNRGSNGFAIAYVYDGNGNLLRQKNLARDANHNRLPDLWEFLHGLTNNASFYADSDGDGWTDAQEWQADTSPTNFANRPGLLDNPGLNIASLALPFTPSNFVVGVGQLNGSGTEEIVIGADGEPGTNTNFLIVLTQGATNWLAQRVDVGAFGVTSIAVGQPTNRPSSSIYLGLRGATNGSGRVMEFTGLGSSWQSNLVALSTNRTAFVLGMVGTNLVVSLGTTNIRAGTLAAATFSAGWTLSLEDTNGSERGLAALGNSGSGRAILRLLDSGRIAVSRIITSTNPWPTEGLSAYYPLNINATDRFGLAGAAYSGNGDFINLNGNRPISGVQNAFTVSAWFRANNANLGNIFVHRAPFRDVVLGKAQDGRVLWDVHDNTGLLHILQSQPLPFGQWIHAVGTYDGTTQRLFVDGALVASSQWTGIVDWDANYLGDGIAGQPSDTSYRFDGTIDDLRIYTRALSGSELTLIRAGLFSGTIEEPASDDRLLWRGTSLALGSLRSSLGNSVLYTFGEDLNQNGALDFGDNFLTAEFLVTGSNSTLLTLSTQRVATATGQGYGLVALNFLNQSNEVFFTGEPDGQVFAWSATGSTNPLQRQLFSGQYAGQAWHAMAAVKTLKSGEGLLGLLVNPATPNKCEVILWPPQSQLPQAASFPQTAPLARVMPNPANGGNMANVTVRIWDAEGNASLPLLQFSPDTTNWFDVTNILTVGGVTYSLATRVPALPGGSSHTLVWNAGAIFPPGVTNIFLRTRAKDITLLGDWSEPMPYQLTLTLDSDGDGLPDDWEIGAFGNIAAQNGDGDADGDGFKNSFEHLAGTNPTDASSSLKLRIEPLVGAVKLSWPGGSNAAQVLQRTWAVPLGWQDVFTNPASTPGGFTNAITATNYFFQLRLQP